MLSHISFFTNQSENDIHSIIHRLYKSNVDSSIVRYSEDSDGSRVIDVKSTVYNIRNSRVVWVNCFISRDFTDTYTVHLIINHAYSSATRDLKAEGFNTLKDACTARDTLLLVAYGLAVDMTKGVR